MWPVYCAEIKTEAATVQCSVHVLTLTAVVVSHHRRTSPATSSMPRRRRRRRPPGSDHVGPSPHRQRLSDAAAAAVSATRSSFVRPGNINVAARVCARAAPWSSSPHGLTVRPRSASALHRANCLPRSRRLPRTGTARHSTENVPYTLCRHAQFLSHTRHLRPIL